MKKKWICYLISMLCLVHLTGCAAEPQTDEGSTEAMTAEETTEAEISLNVPEITQIRTICELATLECYYHNVAKATKEKGSGFTHWGEIDRTFWIQYKGTAKIGVNMSDVAMTTENGVYTITIPKAEILSITVDPESFTEDSYIFSEDGWNPNHITADDQTRAIEAAQSNMRETVLNNSALLLNAQNRAKKLIENYIDQLEAASNTNFVVRWNYAENTTEEQPTTEQSTVQQ